MRVVIPSVNYADTLAVVLPRWLEYVPAESIRIVTTLNDAQTLDIASQHHVDALRTTVWRTRGHVFDKAAALDEAFGFASLPEGTP